MGIVDKAKEALSGHSSQAKDGIEAAADKADETTGGRYSEQLDTGADKARDGVDTMAGRSGNMGPGAPTGPTDKAGNAGQNSNDAEVERGIDDLREDF